MSSLIFPFDVSSRFANTASSLACKRTRRNPTKPWYSEATLFSRRKSQVQYCGCCAKHCSYVKPLHLPFKIFKTLVAKQRKQRLSARPGIGWRQIISLSHPSMQDVHPQSAWCAFSESSISQIVTRIVTFTSNPFLIFF